jgi:hypothetical protein
LSAPAVATDAASSCISTGMTSVGQTVRIHAKGGQFVLAGALRNHGESGSGGYIFGLSGYLADSP